MPIKQLKKPNIKTYIPKVNVLYNKKHIDLMKKYDK